MMKIKVQRAQHSKKTKRGQLPFRKIKQLFITHKIDISKQKLLHIDDPNYFQTQATMKPVIEKKN